MKGECASVWTMCRIIHVHFPTMVSRITIYTSKLRIERGGIGLGKKAQETSLDTGIYTPDSLHLCYTAHFTDSAVPPTNMDWSVFIRISYHQYGRTDVML